MRKTRLLLVLAAVVMVASGCSGTITIDFGSPSGSTERSETQVWNESEVVDAVGLRKNDRGSGWTFSADSGRFCDVAVVMTNKSQVDLYVNAGDVVATNPSGTAGVKIVDAESRSCLDTAEKRLRDLD